MSTNTRTLLVDSNYYIHRAYNIVAKKRRPEFLEKNVLTMLLTMICSDFAHVKATHLGCCFDAPDSFRYKIWPQYKANRKDNEDGEGTAIVNDKGEHLVLESASSFVPAAMQMLQHAGIAVFQVKKRESDDVLASLAHNLPGRIVIGTRDKDLCACVNDSIKVYWPTEKMMLDKDAVFNHYGVYPNQIRDYLMLIGDKVDNIPGVPQVGEDRARSLLARYKTIEDAIANNKKVHAFMKPHGQRLKLAQLLTTLRVEDLGVSIDDLLPKKEDKRALEQMIWKIPSSLSELRNAVRVTNMKGLFGS